MHSSEECPLVRWVAAARVCMAYVVMGICGMRVTSSVCRTTLAVTIRLKSYGQSLVPQAVWERHAPPVRAMEEPLHGTTWNMISPLADNGRTSEVQEGCQVPERRQSLRENA